jgi:hypothetical protein
MIEFGQGLGAPALFLVGLGVGERSADLSGNQAEETSVAFVKHPEGVQADNQNAGPSRLPGGHDGKGNGCRRRVMPSAAGKPGAGFGGKVGNQARFLLAQHLCQWPKRGLGSRTPGDGVVFGDAGGADQ